MTEFFNTLLPVVLDIVDRALLITVGACVMGLILFVVADFRHFRKLRRNLAYDKLLMVENMKRFVDRSIEQQGREQGSTDIDCNANVVANAVTGEKEIYGYIQFPHKGELVTRKLKIVRKSDNTVAGEAYKYSIHEVPDDVAYDVSTDEVPMAALVEGPEQEQYWIETLPPLKTGQQWKLVTRIRR